MRFEEKSSKTLVLVENGDQSSVIADAYADSKGGATIAFTPDVGSCVSALDPKANVPVKIVLADSGEAIELAEVARRLGMWLREQGR